MLNLNGLSKKEILRFEEFVNSPFFNKYKTITSLFYYLRSHYPKITENDVSKKEISIHVYNEKKVNDLKIRKLVSMFNILFDKFLVSEKMEKDVNLQIPILLEELLKKNDLKRFNHYYKLLLKLKKVKFSADDSLYRSLFEAERINFRLYVLGNYKSAAQTLKRYNKYLDLYILYLRLEEIDIFESIKYVSPLNLNLENLKSEILLFVSNNLHEIKTDHPAIYQLYIKIVLLDNMDKKSYAEFERFYFKNKKKFKGKLLSECIDSYFTYWQMKYLSMIDLNTSKKKLFNFFDEYFVRKEPIEEVLNNGYIGYSLFLTAVIVGCSLKKFKWVENFINYNKGLLYPETSADVYHYAYSTFFFSQANYVKSLDNLNKISFRISVLDEMVKILFMLNYYETNYYDGIVRLLGNFKDIFRKKNPDNICH